MTAKKSGFPWLVADIGGTNARFGLLRQPGAQVSEVRSLKVRDHETPHGAARAFLDAVLGPGQTAGQACLAIAGPVSGVHPVRLTNSHWVFDRALIERALGAERVLLLNDFEALALSLPGLRAPADVHPLGSGGAAVPGAAMAVLGPGTGLGVAGCVPCPSGWVAVTGEGGHATVSPADAFEDTLLQALRPDYPHVSAERLLSGSGLPTLHLGICRVLGVPEQALPPEEITRRALEGGDGTARTTLDTFCAMLGTFAGNVALTFGARGGLYLAGGLTHVLAEALQASRFRERFEAKGRFRAQLSAIPTMRVTAPHAALSGAAAALAA